jgi:hypothetical protein
MSKIILKKTHLVIGDKVGNKESLYYNFPSMEKLSSGEWIICCREIRRLLDPKGRIKTRRSTDGGKTWYDGVSPTCHDEKDYPQNGYLMCHITELAPKELFAVYMIIYTDESKPLFHPTTDGMQYTRVRITKSFDNGVTWAKPKDIEYEYPDLLVISKAVILSDGSISIPCETHDIWEEGYKKPVAAMFIKSHDRGYTFSEGVTVACDPFMLYGDARPVFDGNEISLYFWSYNVSESKDAYVHRSKSVDLGETWSKASPINLKMQITSPLFLEKGLMVCACQDRFSENPGIKALISYDEGMNWDAQSEITVFGANSRPDGTNPFGQFTQFKFGYSTILKLSERQCAICYWHDNSATTSISVSILEIAD